MTPPHPLARLAGVGWHPVLLALTLVVSLWLDAVVSPHAALRSMVAAVLVTAGVTLVATLCLRNGQRAALVVTGLLVVLYLKHLLRLILHLPEQMGPVTFALWMLVLGAAVVLAARIGLRMMGSWSLERATSVFNRVALLLLLGTLISGAATGRLVGAAGLFDQGFGLESPGSVVAAETTALPDVYVVLLDGYPRADALAAAFDLDNRPFLEALRDRGFEVAQNSHADYLWTRLTLSSLLQMAYVEQIESLVAVIDGRAPLNPTIYETVNRNPAFDQARAAGYTVVTVGAGFEEIALREGDVYLDGGYMNEFELKLLNSLFLADVLNVVAPDLASGQYRERIRYALGVLDDVARADHLGARFVFAHLPTPHQPTLFTRDGGGIAVPIGDDFYSDSPIETGEDVDMFRTTYREQLPYLNELIIEAVDGIQAASTTPPIIVLMSDHGSASRVDWRHADLQNPDPAALLERTGTLFAAVTPGREAVFPDDISPVNIFRHLFDAYLDTRLGPAVPPIDGGQITPLDAAVFDEH